MPLLCYNKYVKTPLPDKYHSPEHSGNRIPIAYTD